MKNKKANCFNSFDLVGQIKKNEINIYRNKCRYPAAHTVLLYAVR